MEKYIQNFTEFVNENKVEDKEIFLQQDANDKIKIEIPESLLLREIKAYFKWKKDITVSRLNSLGTSERDKFIKYLSHRHGYKKG